MNLLRRPPVAISLPFGFPLGFLRIFHRTNVTQNHRSPKTVPRPLIKQRWCLRLIKMNSFLRGSGKRNLHTSAYWFTGCTMLFMHLWCLFIYSFYILLVPFSFIFEFLFQLVYQQYSLFKFGLLVWRALSFEHLLQGQVIGFPQLAWVLTLTLVVSFKQCFICAHPSAFVQLRHRVSSSLTWMVFWLNLRLTFRRWREPPFRAVMALCAIVAFSAFMGTLAFRSLWFSLFTWWFWSFTLFSNVGLAQD